MILLNYASQMKEYLGSRVIDIQTLLDNKYYSYDSQVRLVVKQGVILLQGPLSRVSLTSLLDDLSRE